MTRKQFNKVRSVLLMRCKRAAEDHYTTNIQKFAVTSEEKFVASIMNVQNKLREKILNF